MLQCPVVFTGMADVAGGRKLSFVSRACINAPAPPPAEAAPRSTGAVGQRAALRPVDCAARRGERSVGRRWYVAAVKPGYEDAAERHLARQGFESFTPRCRKTVRHARRQIERHVPLFPGYVFVAFDIADCPWRSVNGTFGVRSLVMAGERPVPVPPGLVEHFIEMTDNSGLMAAELRPGQRVEILSGPFAQLAGTIERLDGKGRVCVLLRLLNGESPVTMDRSALWPAA